MRQTARTALRFHRHSLTLHLPCQNGSLKTPSKSTSRWYWKNMAGTFKPHTGFYVNSKKEASRKARGWNRASHGNIKGMKMSIRLVFFPRVLHRVGMHARAWISILQWGLCVHACACVWDMNSAIRQLNNHEEVAFSNEGIVPPRCTIFCLLECCERCQVAHISFKTTPRGRATEKEKKKRLLPLLFNSQTKDVLLCHNKRWITSDRDD